MPDEKQYYTAKGGDTWDRIAFALWTNEGMLHVLIAANPLLADVVIFEGGELVRIPDVEEPLKTESLPPWRREE